MELVPGVFTDESGPQQPQSARALSAMSVDVFSPNPDYGGNPASPDYTGLPGYDPNYAPQFRHDHGTGSPAHSRLPSTRVPAGAGSENRLESIEQSPAPGAPTQSHRTTTTTDTEPAQPQPVEHYGILIAVPQHGSSEAAFNRMQHLSADTKKILFAKFDNRSRKNSWEKNWASPAHCGISTKAGRRSEPAQVWATPAYLPCHYCHNQHNRGNNRDCFYFVGLNHILLTSRPDNVAANDDDADGPRRVPGTLATHVRVYNPVTMMLPEVRREGNGL
jgi:hypothetical protein